MSNESKRIIASAEIATAADLVNFLVGLPDDKVELGLVNVYGLFSAHPEDGDGELASAKCIENTLTDGSTTYDVDLSFE